jgi:hypothetical protein
MRELEAAHAYYLYSVFAGPNGEASKVYFAGNCLLYILDKKTPWTWHEFKEYLEEGFRQYIHLNSSNSWTLEIIAAQVELHKVLFIMNRGTPPTDLLNQDEYNSPPLPRLPR